jgi:hypothetical protein
MGVRMDASLDIKSVCVGMKNNSKKGYFCTISVCFHSREMDKVSSLKTAPDIQEYL